MRVLAGELKGQRLTTARGATTRPTSDRVRIACLDTLMPYLGAGAFLDVFAGSGGVGIEALSRGAPQAVFLERDRAAFAALRDNLARLALAERARAVPGDALRALAALARAGERFAVVFLDPPYDAPEGPRAIAAAAPLLAPGGVLVVQHASKAPPPPLGGLEAWKSRKLGETTLTFFRAGR